MCAKNDGSLAIVAGRLAQIATSYRLSTPRGQELRHVQIAPLVIGSTTLLAAIHEDLTGRARLLAALNDTSDQLLRAQESERQRIAIELHDSMSQHLAGLALGLGGLRRRVGEDPEARRILDEMSNLTQQAMKETRVLSYLMNAAGRDREGLTVSVRRFVEGFGRRAGLSATFAASGDVDLTDAAVQHAVFRVVQEALSNVYRHAKATTVSVELVREKGTLSARVADNGRGIRVEDIETSAPPLGVGIPGMRARIEQLGGRLGITGDQRRGTVVTATVPPMLREERSETNVR
jgi:signal transduction histidine kinase